MRSPSPSSTRSRRVPAAALVLALGLSLPACGGTGGTDAAGPAPSVASLATDPAPGEVGTAASTAADPAPAPDRRPQLRLDDSPEDVERKQRPYLLCLKEHGHRMLTSRGPLSLDQTDDSATAKAAQKACAGVLWRIPPELDPERNPDFADDFRAQLTCLNARGVPVTKVDEEGSYTYTGQSNLGAAEREQVEKDCEREAFGERK